MDPQYLTLKQVIVCGQNELDVRHLPQGDEPSNLR